MAPVKRDGIGEGQRGTSILGETRSLLSDRELRQRERQRETERQNDFPWRV